MSKPQSNPDCPDLFQFQWGLLPGQFAFVAWRGAVVSECVFRICASCCRWRDTLAGRGDRHRQQVINA
jgi:hypothetical protein